MRAQKPFYVHSNLVAIVFVLIGFSAIGQRYSDVKRFKHHTAITENDTVHFHTYSRDENHKPKSLFLFLQGSEASAIFQISKDKDLIKVRTTIPFSLTDVPEDYMLVMISKKGFNFESRSETDTTIPLSYLENQSLSYRVFQANLVLKEVLKDNCFEKVVAAGHSEGSDVVAKLCATNSDITHIGYFSGGGESQFKDFITNVRKDVVAGNISSEKGQLIIDSLLQKFEEIMENPNATDRFWLGKENTFKRWSSYSEPPIKNLIQIDQPLFVAIGEQDPIVPMESAYTIPVEWVRLGKENLDFNVYPELDHGFRKTSKEGTTVNQWNVVLSDFFQWVYEN